MNRSGGDAAAAPPLRSRVLAWGVHLLTASGAVVGVLALAAAAAGHFTTAALWMLVAFTIDSVDGAMARAARVSEVVPQIDGRRLDDMVDFLNYVIVPAAFMVASGHLWPWGWVMPVLASAYGFSQVEAKTADDFFLGWPSYWNVVAIYLWLLDIAPGAGTAWVTFFAVMVFVPLKYAYPSRLRVLQRPTLVAAGVWLIALALACLRPDSGWATALGWISLAFPAWYLGLSFWLSAKH